MNNEGQHFCMEKSCLALHRDIMHTQLTCSSYVYVVPTLLQYQIVMCSIYFSIHYGKHIIQRPNNRLSLTILHDVSDQFVQLIVYQGDVAHEFFKAEHRYLTGCEDNFANPPFCHLSSTKRFFYLSTTSWQNSLPGFMHDTYILYSL